MSLRPAERRGNLNHDGSRQLGQPVKPAFTLVELMIVVSILGILAAVAFPTFQDHIKQAKEAAAKDNLRVLREAINRYAIEHNDIPPGYPSNDPSNTPMAIYVYRHLVDPGGYIPELPENPLNELSNVQVITTNDSVLPTEATGSAGWLYKPAVGMIWNNQTGTDSEGETYFSY